MVVAVELDFHPAAMADVEVRTFVFPFGVFDDINLQGLEHLLHSRLCIIDERSGFRAAVEETKGCAQVLGILKVEGNEDAFPFLVSGVHHYLLSVNRKNRYPQ